MFQTDPFTLILVLVGLSLLPLVAMVATSYLKIVVVISLIRNALGIQSIPPNMVVNALAVILTFYIMAPVASESWGIIAETQKQRNAVTATAPATAGQGQAGAVTSDPAQLAAHCMEDIDADFVKNVKPLHREDIGQWRLIST